MCVCVLDIKGKLVIFPWQKPLNFKEQNHRSNKPKTQRAEDSLLKSPRGYLVRRDSACVLPNNPASRKTLALQNWMPRLKAFSAGWSSKGPGCAKAGWRPSFVCHCSCAQCGQRGQIVRPPGRIQARQTRCSVPAATAWSCASKPAPNAKAGYKV